MKNLTFLLSREETQTYFHGTYFQARQIEMRYTAACIKGKHYNVYYLTSFGYCLAFAIEG